MKKYGLLSKIRRKYIYQKGSACFHKYENILNQNFKADGTNQKWTTDISYIITPQERL